MVLKIDEVKTSAKDDTTSIKSVKSKEKSLLQSTGKLVSPEEVKSAILGETSIDSLKQFACLLADDNFDLAAEVFLFLVLYFNLKFLVCSD